MSTYNKYFEKKLVDDICNYINYLQNVYGYHISIHCSETCFGENWYRFLKYNYHDHPSLCREIKCSSHAWQHCIDRQPKIIQALKNAPLLGTCYAGVTEYVLPLLDIKGKNCGFLCVSGYVQDYKTAEERALAAARKYNLPKKRLLSALKKLKPDIPDSYTISVQFAPLQDMLTTLFYLNNYEYNLDYASNSQETLYLKMLQRANQGYRDPDFSLHILCEQLGCSYSYSSHIFAKYNKNSFSKYLRSLRIETAKKYLEYTTETISDLAHLSGFGDINYFSSVFRSETGLTPTKWREIYYHINVL